MSVVWIQGRTHLKTTAAVQHHSLSGPVWDGRHHWREVGITREVSATLHALRRLRWYTCVAPSWSNRITSKSTSPTHWGTLKGPRHLASNFTVALSCFIIHKVQGPSGIGKRPILRKHQWWSTTICRMSSKHHLAAWAGWGPAPGLPVWIYKVKYINPW